MSRNDDGLPMLPPWLSESEVTQSGYEAPVQNLPQEDLIPEEAASRRKGRRRSEEAEGAKKRRIGWRRDKSEADEHEEPVRPNGETLPEPPRNLPPLPQRHGGEFQLPYQHSPTLANGGEQAVPPPHWQGEAPSLRSEQWPSQQHPTAPTAETPAWQAPPPPVPQAYSNTADIADPTAAEPTTRMSRPDLPPPPDRTASRPPLPEPPEHAAPERLPDLSQPESPSNDQPPPWLTPMRAPEPPAEPAPKPAPAQPDSLPHPPQSGPAPSTTAFPDPNALPHQTPPSDTANPFTPTPPAPGPFAPPTHTPQSDASTTFAPQSDTPAPTTHSDASTPSAPTTRAPQSDTPAPTAPTTRAPQTDPPGPFAPTTRALQSDTPAPSAPTTRAPQTDPPGPSAATTRAPQTDAPGPFAPATHAPQTDPFAATARAPQSDTPTPSAPTTPPQQSDAHASGPFASTTRAPQSDTAAPGPFMPQAPGPHSGMPQGPRGAAQAPVGDDYVPGAYPGMNSGAPNYAPQQPYPPQQGGQWQEAAPPWGATPPPQQYPPQYGHQGPPPSLDDVPVRRAKKAAGSGWRRAVHHMSGGAINPGMSAEERRLQELVARIRQPVRGDYRIAVLSLKGGVGKTTTTMGIGSIFASIRGDRVIAVDANPDFGTLSQRVPLQTRSTVRDLLLDQAIRSYSDVRRHTSQATSRLEVLASERDPAASEAFSDEEYRKVARILQRFYNIILTDCGTGLMHSAMGGVLELAHSLVLISSSAIDGARSAAATLDWLSLHGHDHLVRNAVVVINLPRPGSPNVGIQQLREYFLSRCRAVHIIPYDAHLSEGAEIDLSRLHKNTKRALVELAATVADDFATDHRRYSV